MKKLLVLALGAFLMTNTVAGAACSADADAATVHFQVVRTLTDIAAGVDRHDWDRVRSAMADEVTTDYTSLFGGEPVTQSSQELVKSWAAFLPGFDSTHHMVTNHTLTGFDEDTATAESDFTATHRLGKGLWVLGGRYSYELGKTNRGWVVTSMTMHALWETGDRKALIEQALERLAKKN